MARVDVVQLRAEGYVHLRAFDEIATSLAEGLRMAGHDATVRENEAGPGRNIVLGAHLLGSDQLAPLPSNTIIYNFEQIADGSLLPPSELDRFAGFEVWDYSTKNVDRWRDRGFDARHVPVGWSPCLERIDRSGEQDIDVLFYGSVNDRRASVLDALAGRGLHVERLFGVYGDERDDAIARSKVVLNVRFYDAKIVEIVRLSYLFANRVPVVSEWSSGTERPDGYDTAALHVGYDDLVDATIGLVADDAARSALGERARACVRAIPWTDTLPDGLATVRPAKKTPARTKRARENKVAKQHKNRPGSAAATREAVLVLGCHRSGTSMLTRLINQGGFGMTGPLIPAAADNPKGFWEDQRVTLLNDQLMARAGTRWDSLAAPGIVDWRADPAYVAIREQLLQHLRSSGEERVVIKDPRITLLLPFWQELLAELGWDVRAVFAVRDPRAVAESLRMRNGFSPVKGTLLWLTYTLIGDAFSRDLDPLVVGYESLLADPELGLSALHTALEMETPLDQLRTYAADTMDAELNRAAAAPSGEPFRAAALAQQVHAAMLAGDIATRDARCGQYLDSLELFLPVINGLRSATTAAVERFG